MRNLPISAGCALMLVCALAARGQSQKAQQPPTPAASTTDSARDLSGVWMQDRPRLNTVNERYWIYRFTLEEPPMTAWGEEQYKSHKSGYGTDGHSIAATNDPVYENCSPAGFPRALLHALPIQIVQIPGEVLVLFEWDSLRHQIFTDGRGHDTALGPSWMGDSIGHWEGDTLVADTVNFSDKTWLDRLGHPHSEQLHVIERLRRVDHDRMTDDLTFEDAKAYTKPWSARMYFVLKPTWTLAEDFCEDRDTFTSIENRETTPAK